MSIILKKCSRCKAEKPHSEFNKNKSNKDGLKTVCRECSREVGREVYARHREKYRLQSLRWYHNNKAKARRAHERWKRKNLQHVKRRGRRNSRLWKLRHPERVREQAKLDQHRRRARINNAPGDGVSADEWKDILEYYGNRCLCCGATDDLTMDHVVPLVVGGAHDPSNAQPLCVSCNCSKQDKTIDYRSTPTIKRWIQMELFDD